MSDHPRPRAILYDFDGVLINSLPVMRLAFGAALKETYPDENFDVDALFEIYQTYLGMGFVEIMNKMSLSPDMHAPFRKHSRHLAPYVAMYAGVTDLLNWGSAQRFVQGIATGKDLARSRELLTQLGIINHFTSLYASDSVSNPKPHPEMAERFCKDNNVNPQDVVFIGDASADISCGNAAGCRTAAAKWGYTPLETLAAHNPTYIFETPQHAKAQLDGMTF